MSKISVRSSWLIFVTIINIVINKLYYQQAIVDNVNEVTTERDLELLGCFRPDLFSIVRKFFQNNRKYITSITLVLDIIKVACIEYQRY